MTTTELLRAVERLDHPRSRSDRGSGSREMSEPKPHWRSTCAAGTSSPVGTGNGATARAAKRSSN